MNIQMVTTAFELPRYEIVRNIGVVSRHLTASPQQNEEDQPW